LHCEKEENVVITVKRTEIWIIPVLCEFSKFSSENDKAVLTHAKYYSQTHTATASVHEYRRTERETNGSHKYSK
jgi:hypothetical protein